MKKLTKGQKGWVTRKTNAKHKIVEGLKEAVALKMIKSLDGWKVSENQVGPAETIYSLSKTLDNSLDKLEQRMVDYIARVDRILA